MGIFSLFRPSRHRDAADALYAALVAQARRIEFYRDLGVPDTLDGRFDAIAVHAFLVLRKLRREGEATAALAQALFDAMFANLDENLREMGVGDMGVGPRIKVMVKAFYGRIAAYGAALEEEGETPLAEALGRNLYRNTSPDPGQVAALAAYVRREAVALDACPAEALIAGRIAFGRPGKAIVP